MAGQPENIELELQNLIAYHAQLRENLEGELLHVKEVEAKFLSLRPPSASEDTVTQQEIKRRMVLSKPVRAELNTTYRAIISTAAELENVTRRIHQIQTMLASAYARR